MSWRFLWHSQSLRACLPHQISRYRQRISGPILDRIDLHSTVQNIEHKNLLKQRTDDTSDQKVRERIITARAIQAKRYLSTTKLNCDMTNTDLKRYAKKIGPEAI